MCANSQPDAIARPHEQVREAAPHEGYIPVEGAGLYYREIGEGEPLVVLHGGPDFDHSYLLPELDRLSDAFRLIYYDQRGRGKSAVGVQAEDVGMESEMEDLDSVREYFGLDSVALLGHSWGGVLAMEYAVRHPERVSHLVLMNTAPASYADVTLLRQDRRERAAADLAELKVLASAPGYDEGVLEADAAYYRVHFRSTFKDPAQLEKVVRSLRSNVTPEGVVKARAIEDRLMDETWRRGDYDLLPRLRGLNIPTLIIHGDGDLVPPECAAHIAQAIPGARFVLLRDCGHFSYLECPDEVRRALVDFFQST